MRKTVIILLSFSLMLIYACSDNSDDEESNIPDIPQIHQHNPAIPDDDWGPDALTDVNGIYIEWDANQEDNLAGYNVYRTVDADRDFKLINTVSKDVNFFEDLDVELSTKYYYRITAFNKERVESKMSKMVWYTLLPKAQLIEPVNQAILNTSTPKFQWLGIGEADVYILRVFATELENNEWEEIWHCKKYSYDALEAVYNENNQAIEELKPNKDYRWRVDVDGGTCVGSESFWRRFSIN